MATPLPCGVFIKALFPASIPAPNNVDAASLASKFTSSSCVDGPAGPVVAGAAVGATGPAVGAAVRGSVCSVCSSDVVDGVASFPSCV